MDYYSRNKVKGATPIYAVGDGVVAVYFSLGSWWGQPYDRTGKRSGVAVIGDSMENAIMKVGIAYGNSHSYEIQGKGDDLEDTIEFTPRLGTAVDRMNEMSENGKITTVTLISMVGGKWTRSKVFTKFNPWGEE